MHRIALLGHDQFLIGRVRAAAADLAGVSVLPMLPSKFAPELAVLKPVLVLIDLGGSDTLAMLPQIIASVTASAGDVPVVTIGNASDAGQVLAAVRAGSNDVIDREEPIANLRAAIERRVVAANECKPGEMCGFSVVLNAQPGGGGGLFALNLAVLKATRAKEALYVDCQLPASEAGAALDIGISYSLADAARDIGRMDRTLLLALTRWADRLGVDGARELASVLRQSLAQGTELAPTLREFAREFAERRIFAAREAIGKKTTQMTIAMLVLLMPALMIVLAGPAVSTLGTTIKQISNTK